MTPTRHPTPSIDDELLSAYLDGQATPDERRQVESSLQNDPAAAQALSEMRYTIGLLRELPPVPVPRAFTLSEATVGQAGRSRSGWLAWLQPAYLRSATAIVAVCLLFLLIGNFGWQAGLLPGSPQTTAFIESGGLAPGEGNPTDVDAKAPTSAESDMQPAGFLGLSSGALLALEIGLAVLLVLLVILNWRMASGA